MGLTVWSRVPLLALVLLPAQALAGAKEEVAALAPSGLVFVADGAGKELLSQNADEPFVPASVTKIVTAWLAMQVLGGIIVSRPGSASTARACFTCAAAEIPSLSLKSWRC